MAELAFSGNKLAVTSLEEKIAEEEILTGLALRRKNFHFQKDFDFKNPDFKKEVLELYGRHSVDKTKPGWREKKKKIRQNYHEKIKEYFITYYDWPEWTASKISGLVVLPVEKRNTKFLTAWHAILHVGTAIPVGNVSEKYVIPVAKFMDRNPEFITKTNIIADAIPLAEQLLTLAALTYLDREATGIVAQAYDYLGVGSNIVEKATYLSLTARITQVVVRSIAHVKYNKHIPSYASMTSLNPSVFLPAITFFGSEAYLSMKSKLKSKREEEIKLLTEPIKEKTELNKVAPSFAYAPITDTQKTA